MKSFLKTLLIYILITGTITCAVNYLYIQKYKPDGKDTDDQWYKFRDVPDGIEICNLGSSHGLRSYNYDDLEKNYVCFNMGLASQSLSYDKRVLEKYQVNLAPGGVVIVDISYFSCWGYPEESMGEDFESKNKRYYHFLPPRMIKKYDLYTDIMVGKFPSLSAGVLSVIKTIFSPTRLPEETKSYPIRYDTVDISTLQKNVEASCRRHIFENKRDENGELFFNEEEIQALSDIVKICKDNSVTPIFVTVPYLKEYTEEITKEDSDFFDRFNNWIYSISAKLKVDYYDYSADKRFVDRYDLFFNGDHLNSKGAREFTDILYDEVLKDKIDLNRIRRH